MSLFFKFYKDILDYLFDSNNFSSSDFNDGSYPVDFEFTLDRLDFYFPYFDENNIPYSKYQSVGKQYNPTKVAGFALANYNKYKKTKNQLNKDSFLRMADWFMSFNNALYLYNYDWGMNKAPWLSCMSQGQAASVLVRAYILTEETKYLKHALKSLSPFLKSIEKGGVQSFLDNKYLFLEEFPDSENAHVLNGFLFAFIGLLEVLECTKDDVFDDLKHTLNLTLMENIDRWGAGKWSFYQLDTDSKIKNYCTPSYHNLHISQLKFIDYKMPNERFKKTIKRWEKGKHSFFVRFKALIYKIAYRLTNKAPR